MEDIIERILEKENIYYKEITKATSGFTNIVYFIDDKVIKIGTDEKSKSKLAKEISIYKNVKIDNIPKYIASGEIENYSYLIISKVKGKGLFSIWHDLDDNERENCIKQVAEILKEFNNQNIDFLDENYKLYNWENLIIKELTENIEGIKKLGLDTQKISEFILSNNLFKENKYGLVYNDAHFDNFIYDNGKLSLIDFDRVVYAPIDYEMLIFKTMCDNPSKFASEEDENKTFDEDYIQVYDWIKKYYKELFEVPNIEARIKIYQFNYLCRQALKINDKEWTKKLVKEF